MGLSSHRPSSVPRSGYTSCVLRRSLCPWEGKENLPLRYSDIDKVLTVESRTFSVFTLNSVREVGDHVLGDTEGGVTALKTAVVTCEVRVPVALWLWLCHKDKRARNKLFLSSSGIRDRFPRPRFPDSHPSPAPCAGP